MVCCYWSLTSYFSNCLEHIQLERMHLWRFGMPVTITSKTIKVTCH